MNHHNMSSSVKEGESSQPARTLINIDGDQLSSTLAAVVISIVEEALRPIIQRLEEACNHAVGARSSGTIVTQARANGNKNILFTYSQIKDSQKTLMWKGKSSNVVKATLLDQTVAIKWLKTTERRNIYDHEVFMLSHLSHPNIINLIGCCAHKDERMIVYEYMPLGSLYDHLHDRKSGQLALDWNTRMKIALGIAKGLSYLHNRANPRVIYGHLKSSKILLGHGFHPKISDFKTAAPFHDQSTSTTTAITPYRAPEYSLYGGLTSKLDVFSFGLILLELIMGRRMPLLKPNTSQCYVRVDRVVREKGVHILADPEMKGEFREDMFKRAITVVSVCTQFNPDSRPDMEVVVRAMNYLTSDQYHVSDWPAEFNTVLESLSSNQGRHGVVGRASKLLKPFLCCMPFI